MQTQSSTGRVPQGRRRLRKAVLVIALIVCLYVLAGAIFRLLICIEVRRIAREGDPISIAELALDDPPDVENAAPLYEKAFELMRPSGKFKALHGVWRDPDYIRGPILWNELDAECARFVAVVEATRRAASMPRCTFEHDSEPYLAPENPRVSALAHLLNGYALILAHKGDPDAALEILALALRVADSIDAGSGFGAFLLHAGIYTRTGDSALHIVSRAKVSERRARALVDALAWSDLERDVLAMLKWERALRNSTFDRAAREGVAPEDSLLTDHASPWIRFECSWFGRPVLRLDQLRYLRAMRRGIRDAHVPFRKLPKPEPSGYPCECMRRTGTWSFSNTFVPDWRRWREILDSTRARIDGTRLAIAACVYKSRFGDYPHSLSDLNKLAWKLEMEDPFSGRPLVYKRQADGFLLYSIDSDLKDNGGRANPDYPASREGCDMVWTAHP